MKNFKVQSLIKDYEVVFSNNVNKHLEESVKNTKCFFIVDKKVHELYKNKFEALKGQSVYLLEAIETNKTINQSQEIIKHLLSSGFKKNHKLVAIGGGITQDVTCFVASILFRGGPWEFYPTTLLAQCDSCIGSKSSINIEKYKNQVGTFYPPEKIVVNTDFLETLLQSDIISGIGEIIKVHFLNPEKKYQKLFDFYDVSLERKEELKQLIYDSLQIKKDIIEVDEYDRNYRNILNYGHTFGHALESATDYAIPHGAAVTFGIGISNFISLREGYLSQKDYDKMDLLVEKNSKYHVKDIKDISIDLYWESLKKDKKNIDGNISIILTKGFGEMFKKQIVLNERYKNNIIEYINSKK